MEAIIEKTIIGELNSLTEKALKQEKAFALYRLPQKKEKVLLIQLSNHIEHSADGKLLNHKGFIVSPFYNPDLTQTSIIQPDIIFSSEKGFIKGDFLPDSSEKTNSISRSSIKVSDSQENKNLFVNNVSGAINEINTGQLKKVVIARKAVFNISGISCIKLFNLLDEAYPEAFISLVHLPGKGIWIGASPELLMSVDHNNIFRTTALAGTQVLENDIPLSEAVWTQKEIEEQALVSRYIISCFKSIRLREFEEDGPYTMRTGKLVHLRTDFWADLKTVEVSDVPTKMIHLLHPTSAVCGMPKEEAMNFILNHEKTERDLFSGFLGPVGINNETHLFVNLRCAKIDRDTAELFAGAGITKDSKPEKEFSETESKMNTIGTFLEHAAHL